MENYTLKKHLIMPGNFFSFFRLLSFSLFQQLNHSAMLINISLIEALLWFLIHFLRFNSNHWKKAVLEEKWHLTSTNYGIMFTI